MYCQYIQLPVYRDDLCLILGTHPAAAVTVGEQVHRDGAHVLGRVLRRLGFPCAEAFPHPSAGALRVRFYAAGRCLELMQGYPCRHGVASASRVGRQRLPLLPLREGDSGCESSQGGCDKGVNLVRGGCDRSVNLVKGGVIGVPRGSVTSVYQGYQSRMSVKDAKRSVSTKEGGGKRGEGRGREGEGGEEREAEAWPSLRLLLTLTGSVAVIAYYSSNN